jgi:hypothetical protein
MSEPGRFAGQGKELNLGSFLYVNRLLSFLKEGCPFMRQTPVIAVFSMLVASVFMTPAAALSSTDPATPAVQQPVASQEAPVDNYFGHFGQSVLEVRNRIVTVQGEPDTTLQTADGLNSIEHIDDAVVVWKAQYPHDPWLAAVLAHLFECYVRAGKAHGAHATALLEALVANFPDSKEAAEALRTYARADVASDPLATASTQPGTTVVAGRVVDATTSLPVAGALVLVSDGNSSDPVTAPFATTAADGTFRISGVTSQGKFVVVDPPHGSQYAAYRAALDASAANLTVKLAAPAVAATAVAKP